MRGLFGDRENDIIGCKIDLRIIMTNSNRNDREALPVEELSLGDWLKNMQDYLVGQLITPTGTMFAPYEGDVLREAISDERVNLPGLAQSLPKDLSTGHNIMANGSNHDWLVECLDDAITSLYRKMIFDEEYMTSEEYRTLIISDRNIHANGDFFSKFRSIDHILKLNGELFLEELADSWLIQSLGLSGHMYASDTLDNPNSHRLVSMVVLLNYARTVSGIIQFNQAQYIRLREVLTEFEIKNNYFPPLGSLTLLGMVKRIGGEPVDQLSVEAE